MLDVAAKYKDRLELPFAETIFDFKYKYYYCSVHREKFEVCDSTWQNHEFVSIDKKKNILGYIAYSVDRTSDIAHSLRIINFSENKYTFGKDVFQAIDEVFTKFNFRKLRYGVCVGNPIESTYDKLTAKYGGRIVGTYEKDEKLIDGSLVDYKIYELMRDNYLKRKLRKLHNHVKNDIKQTA